MSSQISWMVVVENRTLGIPAGDQDSKQIWNTCCPALLIDNKVPGESEKVLENVMKVIKGTE